MEEKVVSFEIAKLLKTKGFDASCSYYYHIVDNNKLKRNFHEINFNNERYNESCISAPTQSLVQKWLRDKHNIIVNVNYDFAYTHNWGCEIWKNDILDNNKGIRDSYEDALEYGLDCALSNLI